MSLKWRLAIRVALVLPLIVALMFAPAGSFRFWQAWVFVGLFAMFNAFFLGYFYRRDPGLIARRLKNKEQTSEQRRFRMLWLPLWFAALVLPGLDYRFGWSAAFGGVPVWLAVAGQVLLACSWLLIFEVFRFNSFASTVVEVTQGQRVIAGGPYRVVRHPMYSAFVMMIVALPFALGSYMAMVPAVWLIPLVVYRLIHEESLLRRELPGYVEYCENTRFRLVPRVF
jgi:protein-S-isoprenylcysteine O-methyltransferase Ste14